MRYGAGLASGALLHDVHPDQLRRSVPRVVRIVDHTGGNDEGFAGFDDLRRLAVDAQLGLAL